MLTLIGTNVLTSVHSYSYGNHCQMWFRLGRNTEDNFIFYSPQRSTIDRMRNESARVALENEADYLMFIDDDVLLPIVLGSTAYDILKKADLDIVAANVMIRGYPFEPMWFKKEMKGNQITLPYYRDWKKKKDKDGVLRKDVGAVGFSCVLIKTSLLKKLTIPYFITGSNHTEDIYFCLKALEEYPKVKIGVCVDLICGHILTPEIVTAKNRSNLKDFCEAENPDLLKEGNMDRGLVYHEQINQLMEGDSGVEL